MPHVPGHPIYRPHLCGVSNDWIPSDMYARQRKNGMDWCTLQSFTCQTPGSTWLRYTTRSKGRQSTWLATSHTLLTICRSSPSPSRWGYHIFKFPPNLQYSPVSELTVRLERSANMELNQYKSTADPDVAERGSSQAEKTKTPPSGVLAVDPQSTSGLEV